MLPIFLSVMLPPSFLSFLASILYVNNVNANLYLNIDCCYKSVWLGVYCLTAEGTVKMTVYVNIYASIIKFHSFCSRKWLVIVDQEVYTATTGTFPAVGYSTR